MQIRYHFSGRYRLVAYVLVFGFFLQSCGSSNFSIPHEIVPTVSNTNTQGGREILTIKELPTDGGYLVRSYDNDQICIKEGLSELGKDREFPKKKGYKKGKGKIKEGETTKMSATYVEEEYQTLLARAKDGEAEAQFKLGKMAYKAWKEQGKKEDYEEAKEHLTRAAKQGYRRAIDLLRELEGFTENLTKRETQEEPSKKEGSRRLILSLDGGGIRGVLEAYLLNALEEYITSEINEYFNDPTVPDPEVRLGECFDLIAGTSTGGIIALGMRFLNPDTNRPRYKMHQILEVYKQAGKYIFPSSSWYSKAFNTLASYTFTAQYNPKNLEQVLNRMFSEVNFHKKINLSDLSKPVLITTYDAGKEKLKLFKNPEAGSHSKKDFEIEDFAIKDVARATSAAPTFFEPASIKNRDEQEYHFMDGGVVANNPTLHAYFYAKDGLVLCPPFYVVSLGTGVSKVGKPLKKRSKLGLAKPLISVLMNNSSEETDYFTRQVTRMNKDTYTRLQFRLHKGEDKLDKATEPFIDNLIERAEEVVQGNGGENSEKFQEIQEALLKFYVQRKYYVFYPLVKLARIQLKNGDGRIKLSHNYLVGDDAIKRIKDASENNPLLSGVATLSYLTDRAMWEIIYDLDHHKLLTNVTSLDLSGNQLPTSSFGYLNVFGSLRSLNLSKTGLTVQGLQHLGKASFVVNQSLGKLQALRNPLLNNNPRTFTKLYSMFSHYENLPSLILDSDIYQNLADIYKKEGKKEHFETIRVTLSAVAEAEKLESRTELEIDRLRKFYEYMKREWEMKIDSKAEEELDGMYGEVKSKQNDNPLASSTGKSKNSEKSKTKKAKKEAKQARKEAKKAERKVKKEAKKEAKKQYKKIDKILNKILQGETNFSSETAKKEKED